MNGFKDVIFVTVEINEVFIVEHRAKMERRKRQDMMAGYYTRRLIKRRKNALDFQV